MLDCDNKNVNSYTNWLEEIIGAINDGILVIDSQGIVRLINDEYTNITGVQRENIIGKSLVKVRKGALLPKTLEDGKRRSGVYRKEGNVEYVVDMAPIYKHGSMVGAVSVLKSLTEVHKLTKELERSKEKLVAFANTFGHLYQAKYTFNDIIGKDAGLKNTVNLAQKAARSDLNILIQGESGTGKELFAHAIHSESARAKHPFVPVNCAAIPSSLLESELFGYVEGSFTNSKKGGKMGLFELAHNGTLFLDEIGDLPFELQAKLLRVLQDGRIRKVGSLQEQEIDVQLITATNKDLNTMVEKQRFREDLYYRLNGIEIMIPPLRSRKGDIALFIRHSLETSSSQPLQLTEHARKVLMDYEWPGNTRELNNVVHFAMNMAEKGCIDCSHLPEAVRKGHQLMETDHLGASLKDILKKTEQKVILQTIDTYGNTLAGKKKAADQLGISLASLYSKFKEYNGSN
ncbi:PAS domain S-box-containing protein [Scopulibacillus darangshiensis]|uniref:PAS domain S-box-containing protein n=1 Tax=Scopulibacillus darangshiensis TaxID=442528 RepID=A0A4R2NIP0_9BACL|nr:sigma 54-interacting transcriptional regulator [Scopulibacillus darangshiensis]TCP21152.1 PAS domain S-box-containing protein [Scopulibacillus darangshiensis]